jgi:hypothetical protein
MNNEPRLIDPSLVNPPQLEAVSPEELTLVSGGGWLTRVASWTLDKLGVTGTLRGLNLPE